MMSDPAQNPKQGLDRIFYVLKDPEHSAARLQSIFERNELLAVKRKALEAQELAWEASETAIFSDAKSAVFAVHRLIEASIDIRPNDKEELLATATEACQRITDRSDDADGRGRWGHALMAQLCRQIDRMLQDGMLE